MKARLVLLGIIVFILTLMQPGKTLAAPPDVKRVLVLYSFNQEYPIQAQFTHGLRKGMDEQGQRNIHYFYEHLDLPAHAREGQFQDNLAHFLGQKYAYIKPDIIIVQSKPAADFMARYGTAVFGDAPAIISMIDQQGFNTAELPTGYTAVFGSFDVCKAVRLIVDSRPSTKKIYVILGSSETEKRIQADYTRQLAKLGNSVDIVYLSDLTFPEMLERVKTVEKEAAILYTFTYADKAGNTLVPARAMPGISASAPVPVYVILDSYMGTGGVGGYMASWEVLGERVAAITGEVLQGKSIGEFPVETYEAAAYRFDWRQLKRWDIKEDLLPAGSRIDHKELTFWEAYRRHVVGAVTLTILQTILVVLLLVNRHRRKKAEEELLELNARLERRVHERTNQLQEINATLEEEIAERQAAQDELQKSRDQLMANKERLDQYSKELEESNNEIKSFANIVAHDFRAPMVNLKGFSQELSLSLNELREMLRDAKAELPAEVSAKAEEILEKDVPDAQRYIDSSVDRLERMVDVLLKLTRLGRRVLSFVSIDMNELVANTVQSYRHEIEKRGITVTVGPLPVISADRLAMEQIFGNLLDNAIKYQQDGRPGEIKIYCTPTDDEYIFTVEDNGRGIAQEDHDKVFEIFRRSGSQDTPGEGMGLAYVRTLVRHMGGRIWCESTLGVGTRMIFTTPNRPAQS